MNRTTLTSIVASLSILLGTPSFAQMSYGMQSSPAQTEPFHRIQQPLWVKGLVTAGGLGLIGLELWWFLVSKPKSR